MNSSHPNDLSEIRQNVIALCRQSEFRQAKTLLDSVDGSLFDAGMYSLLGNINGKLGDFSEAVDNFRESVRLQPASMQAHFGLGRALMMLQRPVEAEQSLKTVLQIKPDFIPGWLELGRMYGAAGDVERAVGCLTDALKHEPESEAVLLELGKLHVVWNRPDIAINYFNRILEANGKNAEAWHLLGRVYLNKAQVDVAEDYFNRALDIDPSYTNAYVDVGYLHLILNRVEKAMQTYEKALSIQPNSIEARVGRAKVFDQKGDPDSVYAEIAPFIDKGQKHVDVGVLFAKICRHYDRCGDAIDYLEKMISAVGGNSLRDGKIRFALGDLYDRAGEYDSAFMNYKAANDLRVDAFNRIEHRACIDKLIETCNWNHFMKSPRSTQTTERPVFIVGMPRSGTTLTEQILSSHPDVYGAGEIITFPEIIRNLPQHLGTGTAYPDNLENLTVEILDRFAKTYLAGIAELDDSASRVVDKTLANYLYLGLISFMFPKAKIIHVRRDPRDTCLSIYFQNFDDSHAYATRLKNLGFYYNEYERVMKHWKSLLNIPVYEVQYEELVANQERISRELIDFIGLEWDDRVLEFHKTRRSVVTASYDQVRQKMYTRSTQRWKNYEKHIGPLVEALGLQDAAG